MQRFSVLTADSLLQLALLMNNTKPAIGRVIYIGENKGDLSSLLDNEHFADLSKPYLVIFDAEPVLVQTMEDMLTFGDSSLMDLTMKTTNSA